MLPTNGRAARTSVLHNFFSIRMSSPTSKRTGSFSITISASLVPPVSPTWNDWRAGIDGLYGNGLRRDFANTQKNHPYETFNLNLSRRSQVTEKTAVKIRFDVVNILDSIYELRDGSGIGVGAPQFGQRRGFYGTVAYDF